MVDEAILKLLVEPLNQRLDRQDRVLEQIHREVRATNGRVTKLERVRDIADDRDERRVRAGDRRRSRLEVGLAFVGALAMLGAFVEGVLQVVGVR